MVFPIWVGLKGIFCRQRTENLTRTVLDLGYVSFTKKLSPAVQNVQLEVF